MRKFLKSEIDLIYDQIQPEEEVLWRGKPKLIPNMAYLSTLLFVLLVILLMLILRVINLKQENNLLDDWFFVSLFLIEIGIIIYTLIYTDNYFKKNLNIFYVITSTRVVIFNSKKERIIYSKLFPTIKLLRLKKSVFDSGTVVFDIDIVDSRIIEIGFNNIDNADEVLDIINHQIHHMRNKE